MIFYCISCVLQEARWDVKKPVSIRHPMLYNWRMDTEKLNYDFDPEKNVKLKQERGISFEEIITAIEEGHLINIIDHPSTGRFKHQKIYVVEIDGYIYLTPFVKQNATKAFLKTIFPSRKLTKQYLIKLTRGK